MLLRSYSAPIPSSFLPHSMESSSEQELNHHLPRTLASPRHKKTAPLLKNHHQEEIEQKFHKKKTTPSMRELFSSSSLDKQVLYHDEGGKKVGKLQTLVMGGGGMGCDGGSICGGCNGSGRDSGGGNGNGWENNYGRDETDAYYQNMIEANPNNSLLLGNYAKFLKEVINLVYLSKSDSLLELDHVINRIHAVSTLMVVDRDRTLHISIHNLIFFKTKIPNLKFESFNLDPTIINVPTACNLDSKTMNQKFKSNMSDQILTYNI